MTAREEADSAQVTGLWANARRAAQLERHLGEADLVPPCVAYERSRAGRVPRSLRHARGAIALGQGLILGRYPFGLEDDTRITIPGVAAAVRVSTARLFERLLGTLTFADGSSICPAN